MLRAHTPVTLLHGSLDEFLRELPLIRDGAEEGFHQGRVAIRRIREVLPLVRDEYDEQLVEEVQARLRRAAKALGRARDADVAQHLIHEVETRFLAAPRAIGALRQSIAADQQNARRRAIKSLESLVLTELPHEFARARRRRGLSAPLGTGWRSVLREHIVRRAADVRTAVEHASGVYFPNRAHGARIAVKQLRYALELAKATDTWRLPRANRTLKAVQAALGEAHDREVLIARLRDLPPETNADGAALEQFLHADIHGFHQSYVRCRPDVLRICDAISGDGRRSGHHGWWLAASIAVPSLLLATRVAAHHGPKQPVQRQLRLALR